ncbi:MAG TPA: hypothetical protein VMT54_20175 [Candidatus Cybelea sp.]|nr:hypothetical protein [Candidatus Cybelea sp.]
MTRSYASFPIATCRALALAALALFGLAMLVPAEAQSVVARGGVHEDFARLVLDFTQPVDAKIVGEGGHIELHFDRPQALDLAAARANLNDYLRKATLSPDRRTLALDFAAPVTWQAFNDGTKLALDFAFADNSSQQALAKGPDAATFNLATRAEGQAAVAAAPAPPPRIAVPIRVGEHEGYSRLAFDWPKDVAYAVKRSGDAAELVFASPASIDLEKVVGDLPPRLNGLSVAPTGNGVSVKIALKPGTVLRDFRSGKTVVLDIYDQTAANIPPEAQSSAAQAPTATGSVAETLVPVPALPAPPEEIGVGQEPPPPQLAAVAPELQSAMPEAPAKPKPGPTPAATPQSPGISGPGVAVPLEPAATPAFTPPRVPPQPVEVKVTALPMKDGATLYFDWPKRVALGVFRRGDALWLVFDAPARPDLRALQRVVPSIGKIETVASPFGLALRLVGGTAAQPLTETEGARWKITLQPGVAIRPPRPLEQPQRETLPDGRTSVIVKAIASGTAVELQDPADQAKLVVTPEQLAGFGVAHASNWADFKLLPTYQGVVVQPLNDRPKIEAAPNGVIITTPPQGAPEPQPQSTAPAAPMASATPAPATTPMPAATPAPATTPAPAASAPPPAQPLKVAGSLFDMAAWRRGGDEKFLTTQQDLENAMSAAAPRDKERAELDLAEFYLANGYGPEASGLIDQIRRDDHNADNSPLIMAIGATAKTMGGEYDAADRMLASPALQGVAEANLLKGYILANRGDSAGAAKLFEGPLPDISTYPKDFRAQLRLWATRSLIDAGDPLTAQNFLDPLKSDQPDPDTAARAAWLDGLRQQKLGNNEAAMQIWASLTDSPIDEIKARSQFAVISQQLDEKKIAPQDALAKLEALRFLWRGGTFEFDLLYRLGHLYFDTDQPRKGLLTLRQAATRFPDHPMAKQATDDMAAEFRHLYLEGAADRLSPLAAIGLYDEFRELTPTGLDGERMIAALADRMVNVDDLPDAADLLDRQVRTRLSGLAKVAAGTRLAAIRLLDDKPDLALKALAASDDPAGVDSGLADERRRLQARALFDTGDTVKGLDLVHDDASLEGLWLKSDMLWRLHEWQSAADSLGQLIDAEQAKRATAVSAAAGPDIAKNPASVLDQALAQAQAAAAADAASSANATNPAPAANPSAANPPAANAPAPAANAPAANPPAATQPAAPAAPQYDPVLARLVLKRAVAMSLANDRRGLKDLAHGFGKQMETSALAEPFKVLTSPDTGLAESITAQKKSVDELGAFTDEYKKILQSEALSGATEPKPDLGPTAPIDRPAATSGAGQAPQPAPNQTADNQQPAN